MDVEKMFRHTKSISKEQAAAIGNIEDRFCAMAEAMAAQLPESREKSIVFTKLQEAKFFAVESIAKNGA